MQAEPDTAVSDVDGQIPSPSGCDVANEEAERVRKAIDGLPEAQRVVVLLHRFEGLTFGEIADAP